MSPSRKTFHQLQCEMDEFAWGAYAPIRQERGLLRSEYTADTLRGHYGLPPVESRFAADPPISA